MHLACVSHAHTPHRCLCRLHAAAAVVPEQVADLAIGAAAGCVAVLLSMPFDCVKTYMQVCVCAHAHTHPCVHVLVLDWAACVHIKQYSRHTRGGSNSALLLSESGLRLGEE